jgi:hypothetical protein
VTSAAAADPESMGYVLRPSPGRIGLSHRAQKLTVYLPVAWMWGAGVAWGSVARIRRPRRSGRRRRWILSPGRRTGRRGRVACGTSSSPTPSTGRGSDRRPGVALASTSPVGERDQAALLAAGSAGPQRDGRRAIAFDRVHYDRSLRRAFVPVAPGGSRPPACAAERGVRRLGHVDLLSQVGHARGRSRGRRGSLCLPTLEA